MPSSTLDWPPELPRTPDREREPTSKFEVGSRQTRSQLDDEMERVGADDWRLSESRGGNDPGVVLHWTKSGEQYAVGCDHYTTKKANLRALYLYVKEKRKMEGRPVATSQSEFATARLPPGDEEHAIAAEPAEPRLSDEEAAELLGVAPDASDRMVRVAFEEAVKQEHPDAGGQGDVDRLKTARDQLLDDA